MFIIQPRKWALRLVSTRLVSIASADVEGKNFALLDDGTSHLSPVIAAETGSRTLQETKRSKSSMISKSSTSS
jgi:hypothetical protein